MKNVLFAILFATLGSQASATTIAASGAGWCNNNYGCNSSLTTIRNAAVGYSDAYRNFFNFDLSNISGQVLSATLSIWNNKNNPAKSTQTSYDLFEASALNYASLGNGTLLGSVNVKQADNGTNHFVDIALNGTALAALEIAEGKSFLFGGMTKDAGLLFGYTNGLPTAMLTVETGAAVTEQDGAAVPEPAGVTLIGLGIVAAFAARRRYKA